MEALQRGDARRTAGTSVFFPVTFLYNDHYWFLSFLKKEKKKTRCVNDGIVKPNGEKRQPLFSFLFLIIQEIIVVQFYVYLKVEEIQTQ